MFDDYEINNIVIAGVVFLVFLAVMIITYFCLAPVVDGFFNNYKTIDVGDLGSASDKVAYFSPMFQTACKVMLALGIASPCAWFVFWVFSREPGLYRRRLL